MQSLGSTRKNEIQSLAIGLREDCGLSEHDIVGSIPDLIEEVGYEYVEESFPDNKCSGFTQFTGGSSQFKIGFNCNNCFTETYKRFTLGHELGHATIPQHTEILRSGNHHYSKPEFQSEDMVELEADHFSICFLAPKNPFQKLLNSKEFVLTDIEVIA
jgi:Zn-dependent peptidase ImmA (M78 family)